MNTAEKKVKNILFVLPEFYPETGGGICSYYVGLLSKLHLYAEWNITVIQGSAYDMLDGKSEWHAIPIHHLSRSLFNAQKENFKHFSIMPEFQNHLAASWAMYELAQSLPTQFDAVVTTDWGLGFLPWIIKGQIPTIVHLHGSIGQIDYYDTRFGMEFWSALYLTAESNLLNYADALATYSLQNVNFWTNKKIAEEKFSLIAPIIENQYTPQIKTKQALFTGLVVGRIQYWKGVIRLCEAIELLTASESAQLKIYWIGRDTYYHDGGTNMDDFLTQKFPTIWKKIILPIGAKTHEEIEDFYKMADFTLVPSTWDMFNITAIEHLLHQKPLICSTGAGASDFLSKSPDIFVYNNTAAGLSEKIKVLLSKTDSELVTIGENAYHYAKQIFVAEKSVAQHIHLVNETISTFKGRADYSDKFSLFTPKNSSGIDGAKEVMIQSWPLKEVTTIISKSIAKKITTHLNSSLQKILGKKK